MNYDDKAFALRGVIQTLELLSTLHKLEKRKLIGHNMPSRFQIGILLRELDELTNTEVSK